MFDKRVFALGIVLWAAGTVLLRAVGHLVFPKAIAGTLVLYAASFALFAIGVPRIFSWLRIEREAWPPAALLMMLPTLILDPFTCALFPVHVPEHGCERSGRVRRLDAHLLRRSGGGSHAPVKRPLIACDEDLCAPPRQARSMARRQKILDAARALFARQGYEATSIEQITTSAGIALGAFYTYFKSKRQLLLVLMDELLERLASLDLRPGDGDLRQFLSAVFRTDIEYHGVIRAWQEATLADPTLSERAAEVEAWTRARIERVFRALRPRAGADVRTFARMMDRHFWALLATAGTMTAREFDREIRVAADVIQRYLSTFPDPARIKRA